MQVSALTPTNPKTTNLTATLFVAASMELKAEKQSAHSNYVTSVAFLPDGKTIVSGSYDETIKVWDAGVLALTPTPILLKSDHPLACDSIPGAQS